MSRITSQMISFIYVYAYIHVFDIDLHALQSCLTVSIIEIFCDEISLIDLANNVRENWQGRLQASEV